MKANIDLQDVRSRLLRDLARRPTPESAVLRAWVWRGGYRKLDEALEEGAEETLPLLRQVMELPLGSRAVLLPHFLEGWNAEEIAEHFGMEPAEAARRLREGMWELRERLKSATH